MPFNPVPNRRPIATFSRDAAYHMIRPLTRAGGGSSSIHLVEHKTTHILCVRKKLNGSVRSWREEMELLKSLQHPNVVEYIDAFIDVSRGRARETGALFTEWCDLGSLGDFETKMLDRRTKVPEAFVWHVLKALIDAVHYCHRGPGGGGQWESVVHRDIKPDNVFLKSPRRAGDYAIVKLGDFGSAIGASDPRYHTYNGRRGTPGWEPPEAPNFGMRGDVWGVGAVAQSLCRLGIDEIDPARGVGKHYSEDLDECVRACLTFHKFERPYAGEVALMIEELGVGARYNFEGLPPWAFR